MSLAEFEDPAYAPQSGLHDDPMNGDVHQVGGEEEEGQGDETAPAISDDSSEEPEEDEDEARRIREGFIVDEDEEEEEEESKEERRRRKKRRKHKHRRHEDEEEDLDDDDLELLEENTGGRIGRSRLTRLRRGRDSDSPPAASSSKRRSAVESSEDEVDEANIIGAREVQDIQAIWDDDRGGRDDDEDMDDFIDDEDDDEDGAGAMAEEEREERRRERRRLEKERRQAIRSRPELTGIDANAWDEIHDVFGDGHDYDWALAGDDEDGMQDDFPMKNEMKYQDVFEPSEIRERFLTEDDDLIRVQDIPERMQLTTSTLSTSTSLSLPEAFTDAECQEAAAWVTFRLSGQKAREFFMPNGEHHHLLQELVAAVTKVLGFLFISYLEVPYIFTHRRDHIKSFSPNQASVDAVDLLTQEDLWRIYSLGQKYRSLIQRQRALANVYEKYNVRDEYYDGYIRPAIDSVESVADATAWLGMKYKNRKKEQDDIRFHDDVDEALEDKKRKLPSRTSAYEVARKSIVSKLADGYGIKSHEVVINFKASSNSNVNVHFVEDQDLPPIVYAEQFADPDPVKAVQPEELLRQARMILATELGTDPLLRQEIRKLYKDHASFSVLPTERGKNKIDRYHPYHNFKYLSDKPILEMLQSPQFLNILAAEADHLVTLTISLSLDVKQDFQNRLSDAFSSDSFSDTAKAWNDERLKVIQEAIEKHLVPVGEKWVREYLREEVEDYLAKRCGDAFYSKIAIAPYQAPDLQFGESPSVLALSWGKGDYRKDEINAVFMDEAGRFREHTSFPALRDPFKDTDLDEFIDLIKRRKPHVIAIGGHSINTKDLSRRVKEIVQNHINGPENMNVPVEYVQDEVARIYQHSKRAAEEFPSLPLVGKYCVSLARYLQNPVNEYAALGPDLVAITYDEEEQPLVPKEKLLFAIQNALVDVVNRVGVDINRAVNDPYYAHLLLYVAGLGPRKSQALVKKVAALGGHLVNREQFIKSSILTTRIFLNAAGFLRIAQEPHYKEPRSRDGRDMDYSNSPDPLDDTRVHPEDYELARKMATDALELDEEDIHNEHPSHVVYLLMKDRDARKKLDELNLDEFAISMWQTNQERKRNTLDLILRELVGPFYELRVPYKGPEDWDVLTMLTGETQRTLRGGLIISVLIGRLQQGNLYVKLDSGLDGMIEAAFQNENAKEYSSARTNRAYISAVRMDIPTDEFRVELSARQSELDRGDEELRRVKIDSYWNDMQFRRDDELHQRKKRAEVEKTRRVIKHPNFHNFNSQQAEAYLESQHPGDVVIRPSSKGSNHLAVTWKVADRLYQHIDVIESAADPNIASAGTILTIEGPNKTKNEFADLDELIVNHVQAMARRVEELMAHEKFRKEEDELNNFLTNYVAANPSKSIYGFCLNRKRPGHFNLSFLAKRGSPIKTWPVRIAPEAYYLFETPATGVPELCDAFKVRYLHQLTQDAQNMGGASGGKTPYGAGHRTPARTPGHATPGHMSVRHVPRTPNPYGAPAPDGPVPGANSYYGAPPPPPASVPASSPWAAPFGQGYTPQQPPSTTPLHGPPAMAGASGNGWSAGGGGRW